MMEIDHIFEHAASKTQAMYVDRIEKDVCRICNSPLDRIKRGYTGAIIEQIKRLNRVQLIDVVKPIRLSKDDEIDVIAKAFGHIVSNRLTVKLIDEHLEKLKGNKR